MICFGERFLSAFLFLVFAIERTQSWSLLKSPSRYNINIRNQFTKCVATLTSVSLSFATILYPLEADAGMMTFPLPSPLKNNICLMRSGESFSDSKGIIETNAAKKLRQDNALTSTGREQVVAAAKKMVEEGFVPSYVWSSNTERAYETATILSREFQLGQNRIVPEFTFLDARAAGAYEGKPAVESWAEIHIHDEQDGINYRPPFNNDGTLSDSVATVLVRGNQLISTIESMYSGENVVVVAPDSDALSVLQAALYDEDPDSSLPRHARFHFDNAQFRVLHPVVKPSDRLVTGQTIDEAAETTKRMNIIRIIGNSASRDLMSPVKSWYDLWHLSVDNFH